MKINPKVILAYSSAEHRTRTTSTGLSIKGQVKQKNIPLECRVKLYEKFSGRLIEERATDPNGFYEFDHLTRTKFYVVAHHPAGEFNAVIQDNVEPK